MPPVFLCQKSRLIASLGIDSTVSVQGLVIKQLEDAVFIFGIAIDGTLIFRKRNYPDVSTWEDPKIIIHSNN